APRARSAAEIEPPARADAPLRQPPLHHIEGPVCPPLDPPELRPGGVPPPHRVPRVETLGGAHPAFPQAVAGELLRDEMGPVFVVILTQPPDGIGQPLLGRQPLVERRARIRAE